MSDLALETRSSVHELDSDVATRGLDTSDWVLPDVELESNDTVADDFAKSRDRCEATTTEDHPARFSAPVRKDRLAVRLPDRRIKLLQQWECVVHELHDDFVVCEMHDLTDESRPLEFAEVYLDEFHEFDRPLLHEGIVFYWSIGHEVSRLGQVRRYSELRVRRMPALSRLRKGEIARKAEQLSELLLESSD